MNRNWKAAITGFLLSVLVATLALGCGKGAEKGVTITIGEVTDLTGVASSAMKVMYEAFGDMVKYFNDEGLVPGAKLKLATYDMSSDQARERLGYDWLKDHGANPIVAESSTGAITYKPFADRDKIAIASTTTDEAIMAVGALCLSCPSPWGMNALLKWISENQWDYAKGIPEIGWAGWDEPAGVSVMKEMKAYCQDHPSKFKWVGGFAAPLGTQLFSGEVERLKNCDYVSSFFTPTAFLLNGFRAKGLSATFIDVNTAISWKGFLVDMCGWEALDGTLCAAACSYWTHPYPMVDLAKELIERYRPGEADEIYHSGGAYLGVTHAFYALCDIIRLAVQEVGAENFNAQAFYDAAKKYKTTGPMWQGYPSDWGYSETKRNLADDVMIYEFDAEEQDLVAITDWVPAIE